MILQDEIDDKLVRVITLEKELKEILELTSKRNEGENIANANRQVSHFYLISNQPSICYR